MKRFHLRDNKEIDYIFDVIKLMQKGKYKELHTTMGLNGKKYKVDIIEFKEKPSSGKE